MKLNQSVNWIHCPSSVPFAKTKIRGTSPSGRWVLLHGIRHKVKAITVEPIEQDNFPYWTYSCNEWGSDGIDLATLEKLSED